MPDNPSFQREAFDKWQIDKYGVKQAGEDFYFKFFEAGWQAALSAQQPPATVNLTDAERKELLTARCDEAYTDKPDPIAACVERILSARLQAQLAAQPLTIKQQEYKCGYCGAANRVAIEQPPATPRRAGKEKPDARRNRA